MDSRDIPKQILVNNVHSRKMVNSSFGFDEYLEEYIVNYTQNN